MAHIGLTSLTVDSDTPLRISSSQIQDLWTSLDAMHDVVAVKEFSWKRNDADLTLYDYQFTLVDGRRWNQTIRFVDGTAFMTFDVVAEWSLEEFTPHRRVRDSVISLRNRYGLFFVEARWGPG